MDGELRFPCGLGVVTSGVFGGGFAAEFRLVRHAVDVEVEGWVVVVIVTVVITAAVVGVMMPEVGGFDCRDGICQGRHKDELERQGDGGADYHICNCSEGK